MKDGPITVGPPFTFTLYRAEPPGRLTTGFCQATDEAGGPFAIENSAHILGRLNLSNVDKNEHTESEETQDNQMRNTLFPL